MAIMKSNSKSRKTNLKNLAKLMRSSFEKICLLSASDLNFQGSNFISKLIRLLAKSSMKLLKCMTINVNLGCAKIETDATDDTFIMGMGL